MWRGISLANKCQLVFGAAVVLIVASALVWPWLKLPRILDDAQLETSRQVAELWADNPLLSEASNPFRAGPGEPEETLARNLRIRLWPIEQWNGTQFREGFLAIAHQRLKTGAPGEQGRRREYVEAIWDGEDRIYRYAAVVRGGDDTPQAVIVVERRSATVASELLAQRAFLLVAGVFAGSLAVLVFYLILTKLVLSPVRSLRETAERVRAGELSTRSDVRTGDEFEQLSAAFNSMLANLEEQQTLLRGINTSLDMRLHELAERNTALFDAARLKGEFLARVSHELRTPLNSIIGFAEILQDIAAQDEEQPSADLAMLKKRRRYLDNIVGAGRTLLEMINDLLAMAKIEAGRIDLHVQTVNVGETCEALMALIRPLADRKGLRLSLQLQSGSAWATDAREADLPVIESDQQKFQQVLFNFLSNAVKFTPEGGDVILRAEKLQGVDGVQRVRVSVLDTGPGIPHSQHAYIFEKFSQIDGSHTREHQGTGLGLAIAREFAELLQGEIQLVSEIGRGSMFSLILPVRIDPSRTPETARGLTERAALGRRPTVRAVT